MATYTKAAGNSDLITTASWTTGVVPTSADEGTWISTSGTAPTLGGNWSVGKLSFGAVTAAVTLGAASTPNRITLFGLSGTALDLSGNTGNQTVTFNGPVTFGSAGAGNQAVVLSPTANLVFNQAITKSSGTLTISGTGGFLPTADSGTSNSWSGGFVQLDSGTFFIGFGSGTDGASGVLGANTVTLNIGSGNPSIVTGNTANNRGINNPTVIAGSFTVGGTAGTGRTRLDGFITVSPGSYTITVPAGGGGAYFSYNAANNPIQGSGNITKAGGGLLTFGNTAGTVDGTWTGTFLATAGTTTVSGANFLRNATFNTDSVGVTLPATTLRLGGISGSTNYAFPSGLTTFEVGGNISGTPISATWTGGFITNNVPLTKVGTGTQRLGGNSTGRTTAATTINGGAIQLDTSTGLYGSGTNTTTVNSGGALWLNGVTTLSGSLATITGDGVSLNGAIRNVGGNNTHSATITCNGSARIFNDVASTTLTLKNLALGAASTLTLDTGSTATATILLDGTSNTGSGSSKTVIAGSGLVKAPRQATLSNTCPVTVNSGARLQFTDTTSTIGIISNTLSSTNGGTPARIILGA